MSTNLSDILFNRGFGLNRVNNTRNYLAFLAEADKAGNHDNQLSRNETSSFLQTLRGKSQNLNLISGLYGYLDPRSIAPGGTLNNLQDTLRQKIFVGQRILDNFTTFATNGNLVDGQTDGNRTGNSKVISPLDIIGVAQRDGNVSNVSNQDLAPPSTSEFLLSQVFFNLGKHLRDVNV